MELDPGSEWITGLLIFLFVAGLIALALTPVH